MHMRSRASLGIESRSLISGTLGIDGDNLPKPPQPIRDSVSGIAAGAARRLAACVLEAGFLTAVGT